MHDEKGYDTKPDVASFNIVITAISRSGRDDAPMQAERVVQMMQERENTKPDTITFNAVLNAWSQSSKKSAPARAQHILEFLIKHPKLEPDIVTFSTTMNAWARSKDAEKVQKTKELLDRLLTMYEEGDRPKSLKPTSVPFNTLINACGFPNPNATEEERKHFLQIAASTYGRLRNYKGARPDTVTYGNMLKCIGKLLPMGDTRIKLARQIFDQCVSDGLVGYLVWDEMTQTVPFDALEPILPVPLLEGLEVGEDIDHSRLPRRWRNNVPLKQDRIKKEQKMLVLKKELGAKEKPRGMRKGRIKRIGLQYTAHGENSWGAGGGGSGIP
uniref:Pentacotripeptide-repeat region of PRORP domain-containing protein n=1 Tax=Grammatophora oceanica TaxID=210454 RepID=A0A7S1ULC3_9STRA